MCLGQVIFHGGTSSLTSRLQQPCYSVLHRATPCYTPEFKAQPIIPSTPPPRTYLSSSLMLSSILAALKIQSLANWIEDSNPSEDEEPILTKTHNDCISYSLFSAGLCFSIQKANTICIILLFGFHVPLDSMPATCGLGSARPRRGSQVPL